MANLTDISTSASTSSGPNMGLLGSLNFILPFIPAIVIGIAAVVIFIWYRQKYMPEIARQFTKAHHSRGLACFIQDEMGNVGLYIAKKKLPEGVIFIQGKGWFLLPNPPEMPTMDEVMETFQKKVGRPPKNPQEATESLLALYEKRKQEYAAVHGVLVQTPILKGFGRQVFFGSTVAAALSNLQGIAHAHLPNVRLLSPSMYQKTQLDALATGNRLEGQKMAGKDATKWIFAAIAAVMVLGALGLIVYLLTQKPA